VSTGAGSSAGKVGELAPAKAGGDAARVCGLNRGSGNVPLLHRQAWQPFYQPLPGCRVELLPSLVPQQPSSWGRRHGRRTARMDRGGREVELERQSLELLPLS
jgi:hypothetical protein